MPQKHREAPDTGPREVELVAPSTIPRLARGDHRERQLRRLATIALVRSLYGVELGPTPPGPDVCPAGCPFCMAEAASRCPA